MITTIKKGRAVGFLGFVLALLVGFSGIPQALAQTFPSQIPTKAEALEAAVKLIPGLDKAGISNFKASNNAASGDIKLKGETVTVVAFKRPGISKVLVAIAPANFKLSTFLPIPRGTPIDGVAFRNMAFVYVPKGAAKKDVSTSGLPQKVASALNKSGNKVDFNEGLNLFGEADFASSGGVKKVLQAIGLSNFTLPLNGTLPTNLFKVNPKNVRGKLKDQLLDALRLNLKLKRLRIPGMPNSVAIRDAGLAILSKKLKNKREFIAGVNGKLVAKVGSKNIDFNFYILADKAGADSKLVLKGDTKTATTLPFFKPLKLTGMNLVATKSGGKWDVVVNAKAKLNNKDVDVAVTRDADEGTSAEIKGKIKLSDLLPGSISIPGITNVEFDDLQISKGFLQVTGKVKKLDTVVAVFKRNGKTYIAINNPRPIKISSLISKAKGTPLDDASFEYMTYIWAPRGGAESGMEPSVLPSDIADAVKNVVEKVDLKEGLNVIGRMNIERDSKVGKVLVKVGAYKSALPLVGKLSAKLFKKGSGAELKNEILDSLDLKIPLPKLNLPGISRVAKIKHTVLAIKGVKGKVDVQIAGELDVKVSGKTTPFDYDVELVKRQGKKAYVKISAVEEKGRTLSVNMLERFILTNIQFTMDNSRGFWMWSILGDTKIRNTLVSLYYFNNRNNPPYMGLNTKMTLAKVIGSPGLPGLDDVEFDWMEIWKDQFTMGLKVKGISSQLSVFKAGGIKKHFISWVPEAQGRKPSPVSPALFIPGADKTPLKDVTFQDMAFVYNPGASAIKLQTSDLPGGLSGTVKSSLTKSSLKPGLNIFGKMEVSPTGEMGRLLKQVGVTEFSLPLNGGFSPKAFSKNPGAVKNAILDELDLKIKLPTLKIPEIDRFLAFKNGSLKIKGKTPDGKRGIDVAVSGDADLRVKGDSIAFNIDVGYDRAGGSSELDFKGSTDKKWTHPLGIDFLDLDSLTISIDKKKGKYDIDIAAKTDIGSYSRLDVSVNVDEKNGKITDAFFELDGPLKLSEIPGVKDIPNSGKFTINTIKISEHGIEAKTDFGGNKDLDVYLFNGSGWNLIVRQDNLTITEFVPPLRNSPLKHIVLSEAAIVLSKDGLRGPLSGFSEIAQDALKDIYGASAANINVGSGLSLIAAFESRKSRGGMAGAFKRLGLKDERLILTGDIGGLFGGPTKLSVKVALDGQTSAKNQPKWMKSKPGVKAVFSMIATETAGQFDIEFGIGADITAKVDGTELLFDAKTALVIEDEKIGVKIVAILKDQNGWKKPFGIPGFTLKEVGMDLGLDEDGAIHLGFDGSIIVSGDKYAVAADADLLPEALGAPQDIAFIGTASKVDMFFVEEIAINMIGGDFKIDIPSGILPTFTDVKFAFVTPGAQDPDLNITGEGFALKGAMNWLDHELGKMNVSVGPKKGIYAAGKIDNLDLGPLTLKNNNFKMDIGVKSLPSLKINSDIEFIGIKEKFKVAFGKTGVSIDAYTKMGPDFGMDYDLKLSGIDLSVKKPEFKKADFFMKGNFQLDIGKFIAGPARKSLDDVFNGLNAGFKDAEKAIKKAQKKVDGLTKDINAERAKVRREKAKAEAKVQGAENRVNRLYGKLDDEGGDYDRCHGWFSKWLCRVRWGIAIGFTKGEIAVADAALNFVKSLISHFPVDLDPAVAALIAARDTAKGVLYAADEAIKGADDLDRFMKKAIDKLTKDLKNSINIKKAGFSGDLRGIIEHDTPVDLILDAEMFGADINDTFAFKIKDIAYDVGQLGMMGLYALEHLVDKGINDLPGPLKHKLKSAIAKLMDAKKASRDREMAKYKKEFGDYNKTAKAIQARIAAQNTAYLKTKLAESKSGLDFDTTETFTNELIEVGHTGLCLSSVGGKVKQDRCADGAAERWSTKPAPVIKKGRGYVYITQASGGNCIAPEGRWISVTKNIGNPKAPKKGSFTFEGQKFQGDGRISVKKCANTKEYYWKVLKHGDNWLQMVNRATSQCLHFEDSSAIPGQAEASWKPCTGAANQVYRVAGSTTPKYYADNIVLRNDQLGLCVGSANSRGDVPMAACAKAARFNYSVDTRGYVKFINRASGKCLQPSGYGKGAKMIEVACTQLDYQWWSVNSQPGGIIIKNAQTNHCTEPPFNLAEVPPTQVDCKDRHNAVFAPLKDANTGPVWQLTTPASYLRNNSFFNAVFPFERFQGLSRINICTFNFRGNFVSGTVDQESKCVTIGPNGNKNYYSANKYRLLVKAPGMEWRPNSSRRIENHYIPTGGFGGANPKTLYTCRFNQHYQDGFGTSEIGWTSDGRVCNLGYGSRPTNFDILSRVPSKFYELNLTN